MKNKICTKCKIKKPFSEFHKDNRRQCGIGSHCRKCNGEYSKKWRQDNPEENRHQARKNHLKYNYNLSEKEYGTLVKSQKGRCAICNLPETAYRLSIDHNHKTGEVRGLLCRKCNAALGLLDEDANKVKGMLKYLEYLNE